MASEVGSAFVSVVPSAKGFGSTLGRSIGPDIAKQGRRQGGLFGRSFSESSVGPVKRGFSGVAKLAGGALAGVAVGGVFAGFLADAREAAKIGALTNQVIKSTGGAAGVSAKQVSALATSISNKTGIDDEAIQSGANLLLTFTNVRNEVGKGNDVFNRANQAVTDMSAALGQDTKSSAIQLGKALNDPVKGISALSRVGVSFTAQQKDQIKTMVAAGDTVGAQKIILAELGKEFGGAAQAMATPADKLKVTMGNLKEEIGAQLIPIIDRFANFMLSTGIPALKQFGTFVQTNVMPPLRRLGEFIQTYVIPPIRSIASAFQAGGVEGGLGRIGQVIAAALPIIGAALARLGTAFVNWIGPRIPLMIAAAGRLLTALGGWISGIAWPWLSAKVKVWGSAFLNWIGPLIPPLLAKLGALLVRVGGWVVTVGLPRLLGAVKKWGGAFVTWITPLIGPMIAKFVGLLGRIAAWLIFSGLPLLIGGIAKLAIGFTKALPAIWTGMGKIGVQIVRGLISGIKTAGHELHTAFLSILPGPLRAFAAKLGIDSPSTVFAGFGRNIGLGLVEGIQGTGKLVDKTLAGTASKVSGSFQGALTPPTPVGLKGTAPRQADVRVGAPTGAVALTVNNPLPERASETVANGLRRLSWTHGLRVA